jgi:hypothetical protein
MTVAKAAYGSYITLAGTLAEVGAALNAECVTANQVLSIYYDAGTSKTTAIYHR